MMRKIVIFIVMLVHVNGSMFLPQVAETDVYDALGQQKDDINTLYEYVDEVLLGNHDDTPEDEDNDDGQTFHLVKMFDYYFELELTPIKHKSPAGTKKNQFPLYSEAKIFPVTLDIIAPPPKV